ncbi:hypothetical protein DFQ08_101301 [Winogradskyella arenosi]|uniref:Uncharacterized protein n=1 Tax=Winogradskyella arenosi TaxID=533325 RepID=A0A368ZLP8_9FLAO|nr:hypothetical protein DFQ08_101301 [Winogradskyella arenosi]
MKPTSNLPEPTLMESQDFSLMENTFEFVSKVFKLTKKVFML